jgi:PAS domain S-box-containing protein
MLKHLYRFLEVPVTDPTDARRRKLLNILLAGAAVLSLLVILLTAVSQIGSWASSAQEITPIYWVGITLFLSTIVIYAINRFVSGTLASLLFLLLWMLILPFSDLPREVADGRSLFAFTVPIVIAAVLLRPYATFLLAGLSSLEIIFLALFIGEVPNFPAVVGFFMVALVVWLAAHSLEDALANLVALNHDLDQRVVARTQALSDALDREHTEASRNQAILQGIADGVAMFDQNGCVMVTNPALEALLGSSDQPILGKDLTEWLEQAGLSAQDRDSICSYFADPASEVGSVKVRWGSKVVAINIAPVRISNSEAMGRVAVFHDYTREAEGEQMKSDFVAMVSHELRTPLNSILGYSDMLREGVYGKLEHRQIAIVDRVIVNSQKLQVIVNDLLDQAQIEAGQLSFRNRYFHPVELLESMQSVVEGDIRARGLELITKVADDLPKMVYGDPQRLNQILVNLVSNSVKFTEQGSITVNLYRVNESQWAMSVVDTGAGISLEAQKIIFEPFRKVDVDVTSPPGGIGLGLSIVKCLVDLMQGEVCVSSQPEQGSIFTAILPLNITERRLEV